MIVIACGLGRKNSNRRNGKGEKFEVFCLASKSTF